jgi:hypothetical protein
LTLIVITVALLVIGAANALVGFVNLTEATSGVGLIGVGCFLGIAARIVQAWGQERR